MALPAPALVGVTETNALASRACNAARNSVPVPMIDVVAAAGTLFVAGTVVPNSGSKP